MKVVVRYTIEVDEPVLRGIRRQKGEKGIAQGREVKAFLEEQGTKALRRIRWTREQEERERAAAREAKDREKQERIEAKQREAANAEAQLRRERASDWILFSNIGYMARTTCGWCGEMRDCRGRRRSQMACSTCYIDNGAPTVAALAKAAS